MSGGWSLNITTDAGGGSGWQEATNPDQGQANNDQYWWTSGQ